MKEKLRFRCPCCGMVTDVERLDGEAPYELEVFIQRFGGKVKLTDEERKSRRGQSPRKGSARGFIQYERIDGDQAEPVMERIKQRSKQVVDSLSG